MARNSESAISDISSRQSLQRFFLVVLSFLALSVTLIGCDLHNRKRPYGYIRVGPLKNFLKKETLSEEYNLFIRRDERGLYAMSTMCTYDLAPLSLKRAGSKLIFYSHSNESTYDSEGRVLSGPSHHNLPYYKLRIDAKLRGGPVDTLYAIIADEVPPSWRAPL
jgi:Rieske Fe-S protein